MALDAVVTMILTTIGCALMTVGQDEVFFAEQEFGQVKADGLEIISGSDFKKYDGDLTTKQISFYHPIGGSGGPFRDSEIRMAARYSNVESIRISGPNRPISLETIEELAKLTKLRRILLNRVAINPEALVRLLQLELEVLILSDIPVGQSLEFLNTRKLRRLAMYDCGLTNSAALVFTKAIDLEELDFSYNENVNSDFVEQLPELPKLRKLRLIVDHSFQLNSVDKLISLDSLKSFDCEEIDENAALKLRSGGIEVRTIEGFQVRMMNIDD